MAPRKKSINEPCIKCGNTNWKLIQRLTKVRKDGTIPLARICITCDKIWRKGYRQKPDVKAKQSALQQTPEYKAMVAQWAQDNKEKIREYQREYYGKDNRYKKRNGTNAKRLRERMVFPTQRKAIQEFYTNCPDGYHVDHIIPLNGKNVSGLHCIDNLQYLTANQNLRKSNKF